MLDPSQIAKLITEDPDVVSEVVSMSGDQFFGHMGKIYNAATAPVDKEINSKDNKDANKCPKCGKLRDKEGCDDPDCPECPSDCN
ncbi:MAG: hypothetical protein ACXADH_00025 [Candidatus Kariarchaeaceae archaeon]|jgi:hypothetical protein